MLPPSPSRRQQRRRGEAAASEGVGNALERLPSLLLVWAPDGIKRRRRHVGRIISHEGCQEAAPHVQVRRQGQQKEGEGGEGLSTINLPRATLLSGHFSVAIVCLSVLVFRLAFDTTPPFVSYYSTLARRCKALCPYILPNFSQFPTIAVHLTCFNTALLAPAAA